MRFYVAKYLLFWGVYTLIVILGIKHVNASDADSLNIYINNAESCIKYNYVKAFEFARQAQTISSKNNNQVLFAKALYLQAKAKSRQGYYKECLEVLHEAEHIALNEKDSILLGRIELERGRVLVDYGITNEAIDKLFKALSIFENAQMANAKAHAFIHLGRINYYSDNGKEKAEEYYNKALKIFSKTSNQEGIAQALNYNAAIATTDKDFEKALKLFHKAEQINKELNYQGALAINYHNISVIYQEQEDFDKALNYLNKAISINSTIGAQLELAYNKLSLASYHQDKNQNDKAITILEDLFEICEENGFLRLHSIVARRLALIYYAVDKLQESLDYSWEYMFLKDSLNNNINNYKLELLESKKRFEHQQQEKQKAISSALLTNKNQRITFTVIILAILFVSIILFFNLQTKKKWLKIVEEKNKQITAQSDQLKRSIESYKESQKQLARNNKVREKFMSILAHDLINPFNSILGLTDIIIDDKELDNEEIRNYSTQINRTANETHLLLQQLLIWANTQNNKVQLKPTSIDLNVLVRQNIELYQISAESKQIKLEEQLMDNALAFADENCISTIIRNFVSNAIKFTTPKGKITLQTEKHNNGSVTISVIDTGIGMTPEELAQVLNPEDHFTKPGTSKEKGTGLGLNICRDLAARNHGTLSVKSIKGKGTSFTLSLPSGK
ncbi:tetratricopeptide repeat protein [Puteibacter caeruleilacunae]|nr:tetratricopeptide repeat protein [Puteibacter caeruleilacunae]